MSHQDPQTSETAESPAVEEAGEHLTAESLVEEVSIDGMCGVY